MSRFASAFMLKKISFTFGIVISGICEMGNADLRKAVQPRCSADILASASASMNGKAVQAWSAEDWFTYLNGLPLGIANPSQYPTIEIPIEEISEIRDCRLNHVDQICGGKSERDEGLSRAINGLYPEARSFTYLGYKNLVGERFELLRLKSGEVVTVKSLPRAVDAGRELDPITYQAMLNASVTDQLRHANSGITDPLLDHYFEEKLPQASDLSAKAYLSRFNADLLRTKSAQYVLERDASDQDARLLVKRTEKTPHFFLEIIETHLGSPYLASPLPNLNVHTGRLVQRRWLNEILAPLFKDYFVRRGWLFEYLMELYVEAIESLDFTRYVVVRERTAAGVPGQIRAVIGLTRAPYGTVRYLNSLTRAWELRTGPFGSTFASVFGDRSRANWKRTHRPEVSLTQWNAPVPILGMEKHLGLTLPRPSVVERIVGPMTRAEFARHFHCAERSAVSQQVRSSDNACPTPDPSAPIYFGAGEIFEPVKFYIDPNMDERGSAYVEMIRQVLDFLLPRHQGLAFNLNAQFLYTYNPREGAILYRKQGFETITSRELQTKTEGGKQRYLLGATPTRFVERVHSSSPIDRQGEAMLEIESIKASVEQFQRRRDYGRSPRAE